MSSQHSQRPASLVYNSPPNPPLREEEEEEEFHDRDMEDLIEVNLDMFSHDDEKVPEQEEMI